MKKALRSQDKWWERHKDELIVKADVKNMLRVIIPVLEKSKIGYWLGRGVLRNLIVTGEVGDKNSDVDFHIWKEDAEKLIKALGPLIKELNLKIKKDKVYKVAFENRPKYYFEFMFLKEEDGDEGICYHERYDGKRYSPISCFESFDIYDFKGLKIRIPSDPQDYLKCVYGEKWEDRNYEDKKFPNSLEVCKEIVNK